MNYHNTQIQHDVINTLGNSVEPLPKDKIIHEVTNRGFKQQRIYRKAEIIEVLEYLVKLDFVHENNGKYEWFE